MTTDTATGTGRGRVWRAAAAALALLALGATAACETPAPRPVLEPISFAQAAPIRLDVARIEIVDEYLPPLRAPNVEHDFTVTPAQAARLWAEQRLRPGSPASGRTARFVIRNAAVTESRLPVKTGLTGALTTDQAHEYRGVLEVALEIRSDRGFRDGFAEARAEFARTVAENITLNERTWTFHDIARRLIADIDREMERQVAANLGRFRL